MENNTLASCMANVLATKLEISQRAHRESDEGEADMQDWTAEAVRSGITRDVFSDDRGTLGVPGTWYRVRRGSNILLTTRNRGDALRLFQRVVRRVSGA